MRGQATFSAAKGKDNFVLCEHRVIEAMSSPIDLCRYVNGPKFGIARFHTFHVYCKYMPVLPDNAEHSSRPDFMMSSQMVSSPVLANALTFSDSSSVVSSEAPAAFEDSSKYNT